MRHASQDKVGIYLVAASRLLREALAHALCLESGFNIVGSCAPGADTEYDVITSGADLLLLDDFGTARDDLTLLSRLMIATPSMGVILVGVPETERAFLESVRAGAVGYVSRDASAEVLISSVHAVLNGEAACPSHMIVSLFKYDPGRGITDPKFMYETEHARRLNNWIA